MAVEVRSTRKGRSLFTTRLVRGGEVVLEEDPLLLVVAPDHATAACAFCMRLLGMPGAAEGACMGCGCCMQPQHPTALPTRSARTPAPARPLVAAPSECSGCRAAWFCSQQCQQAATATPWGHGAPLCR
jgi:hypothetical protein